MEPIRICKKCGKALPETKEFFYTQFNKKVQKEYFKGSCKECDNSRSALWRKEHQEAQKEYERKRWALCKSDAELAEKRREKNRRCYYASEKYKEICERRKYKEEHADEIIAERKRKEREHRQSEEYQAQRKEAYERNKEHYREYSRTYRHLKAEEERERCRRRRSGISSLPKHLTEEQWGVAKQAFSNRCAYCGRERFLEQEHFIPLSKGGWYTVDNIIPACKSCNCSKRDRDFDEWYTRQPFFSEERKRHILNYLGKEIAV